MITRNYRQKKFRLSVDAEVLLRRHGVSVLRPLCGFQPEGRLHGAERLALRITSADCDVLHPHGHIAVTVL